MKSAIRIFVVLILVAVGYLGGLAWRRLCLPLRGVDVSVNGKPQTEVSAQTCPNGLIRVVIPGESAVLISSDLRGGFYSGTEFHDILGLTFANEPNPVGVSMLSVPKTETDPNFEFTSNSITYTDFQTKHRIAIRIDR